MTNIHEQYCETARTYLHLIAQCMDDECRERLENRLREEREKYSCACRFCRDIDGHSRRIVERHTIEVGR